MYKKKDISTKERMNERMNKRINQQKEYINEWATKGRDEEINGKHMN